MLSQLIIQSRWAFRRQLHTAEAGFVSSGLVAVKVSTPDHERYLGFVGRRRSNPMDLPCFGATKDSCKRANVCHTDLH